MLEDISMEDEVEESSVKATLLKGKKANRNMRCRIGPNIIFTHCKSMTVM